MPNALRFLLFPLLLLLPVEVQAQNRRPIIDVHLHAFGFDEYGHPAPPNEATGRVPSAASDADAIAAAIRELDRHGVVMAIASGPLHHVLAWRDADPDRMVGGAYTGARDVLPDTARLRVLFESDSLQVLGELGLQYRGLALTDSSMAAYLELAERLDVPVALHTGLGDAGSPYGCCPGFRVQLGKPGLVEEVLVRYPRLRIYLMHAGYPFLEETKALLYVYPQLYVDIGVINWALPRAEFHAYLKGLVDAGFGKRIMFGSDQMVWPESIGLAVSAVEAAPFLAPAQKSDIFYHNAARFLRLDEATIARHHGR